MTKYQVRLKGQNIWLQSEGKPELLGFFTTRYVEATGWDDAERRAIELVQVNLQEIVLNQSNDPPAYYVEEVIELIRFPSDIPNPWAVSSNLAGGIYFSATYLPRFTFR